MLAQDLDLAELTQTDSVIPGRLIRPVLTPTVETSSWTNRLIPSCHPGQVPAKWSDALDLDCGICVNVHYLGTRLCRHQVFAPGYPSLSRRRLALRASRADLGALRSFSKEAITHHPSGLEAGRADRHRDLLGQLRSHSLVSTAAHRRGDGSPVFHLPDLCGFAERLSQTQPRQEHWKTYLGLSVCLAGIITIFYDELFSMRADWNIILSSLAVLAASFLAAGMTLVAKHRLSHLDPVTMAYYQLPVGILANLTPLFLPGRSRPLSPQARQPDRASLPRHFRFGAGLCPFLLAPGPDESCQFDSFCVHHTAGRHCFRVSTSG